MHEITPSRNWCDCCAGIGHQGISVEAFNYSSYALGTLVARDVHNHWNMVRDPTMHGYLMTVSVKPADGAAPDPDARRLASARRRSPAGVGAGPPR